MDVRPGKGYSDSMAILRTPAPFATDPDLSRGRLVGEPRSPMRSEFQRDRDRVLHSTAFRRLKHKTQVFVYHEGDLYRTRLTHSLEVAQIARTLCRTLGLDEDLAEALALAHDFGHTPFGHAGEEALDEAMQGFGGFDHNAQTLRILTKLEHRYADFDGLNLTWEALEGVVKHNGPITGPLAKPKKPVPETIFRFNDRFDLELQTFPGPEAQIAALADDIAYNNHDIDDGLRARLFTIEDLRDVPVVGPIISDVLKAHPKLEAPRLAHETVRRMIDRMVRDLLDETRRRIAAAKPDSAAAVRALDHPLVAFSDQLVAESKALRAFLFDNMYRHHRVNLMTAKARRVVRDLFRFYREEPQTLPAEWSRQIRDPKSPEAARVIADYIAGMTDRYALREYRRIFEMDQG